MDTPNEEVWPGVSKLRDYKKSFPSWSPTPLTSIVSGLDTHGIDLLSSMLLYNPAERITAKETLSHRFFTGVQA